MKDLMQITALVPTKKVREISLWLEDNGAVSMMVKAYRNGEAPPAKYGKGKNAHQTGASQQEWLLKHIKGPMRVNQLRKSWIEAGFPQDTMYNALNRAVAKKKLKKVKPGHYAPRS